MFNQTGEVIVWDLSREDDLVIATSGIGDDAHREPVSKVHWMKSQSSKRREHNVCSFNTKMELSYSLFVVANIYPFSYSVTQRNIFFNYKLIIYIEMFSCI